MKFYRVFPDQGKAEIYILFRSGPRYHFGEIHYDATPEALRLIRPLINIKSGDPYLAIRLAEMSQDVSSTKLFKQVDIKPMISQAEAHLAESVATYRSSVLQAFGDVEGQLSGLTATREQAGSVDEALGAARRSADLADKRYRATLKLGEGTTVPSPA